MPSAAPNQSAKTSEYNIHSTIDLVFLIIILFTSNITTGKLALSNSLHRRSMTLSDPTQSANKRIYWDSDAVDGPDCSHTPPFFKFRCGMTDTSATRSLSTPCT